MSAWVSPSLSQVLLCYRVCLHANSQFCVVLPRADTATAIHHTRCREMKSTSTVAFSTELGNALSWALNGIFILQHFEEYSPQMMRKLSNKVVPVEQWSRKKKIVRKFWVHLCLNNLAPDTPLTTVCVLWWTATSSGGIPDSSPAGTDSSTLRSSNRNKRKWKDGLPNDAVGAVYKMHLAWFLSGYHQSLRSWASSLSSIYSCKDLQDFQSALQPKAAA